MDTPGLLYFHRRDNIIAHCGYTNKLKQYPVLTGVLSVLFTHLTYFPGFCQYVLTFAFVKEQDSRIYYLRTHCNSWLPPVLNITCIN